MKAIQLVMHDTGFMQVLLRCKYCHWLAERSRFVQLQPDWISSCEQVFLEDGGLDRTMLACGSEILGGSYRFDLEGASCIRPDGEGGSARRQQLDRRRRNHISAILCLALISMSLLSSLGPPPARSSLSILGSENPASCDQKEVFRMNLFCIAPGCCEETAFWL
jgi:hypothetical protein